MFREQKKAIADACQILNVDLQASYEDIYKSYKKLALQYHPDKNRSPDAEEIFKKIKDAYDLLKIDRATFHNEENIKLPEKFHVPDIFCKYVIPNPTYSESYGKWHIEYNNHKLSIFHPKLKGCRNSISFHDLNSSDPSITFPINFNKTLRTKIGELLIPILPFFFDWLCDDEVEITVRFSKKEEIIKIIYDVYELPMKLIQVITEKLKLKSYQGEEKIFEENSFVDFKFFNSNSILLSNKIQIERVGEWYFEYNDSHLFIFHPKFQGCKNNITFWNLTSDESAISLPINGNKTLQSKIKESLIPIILDPNQWPSDNSIEIAIKIPKKNFPLEETLKVIYDNYSLPQLFSNFINDKIALKHQNNSTVLKL